MHAAGNGIWKAAQVFDRHYFDFESTDPNFAVSKSQSEIQVYGSTHQFDILSNKCSNIWKACQASSSFFYERLLNLRLMPLAALKFVHVLDMTLVIYWKF